MKTHMAQLLKTCLIAGALLVPWLLAISSAGACTGWANKCGYERFSAAVGVVDAGDWGLPYALEPAHRPTVITARYDDEPTPASPSDMELGPYLAQPAVPLEAEGEIIPLVPAPPDAELNDDFDDDGPIISLVPKPNAQAEYLGPYLPGNHVLGYNTSAGGLTWLPGSDDDFGWFSFEDTPTLSSGRNAGFVGSMSFHFLNGPVQTEMPPRLFDFVAGYQRREWIRPNVGWDFAFRVGVFSDFEGSADDGVRFPSHVVTFWRLTPKLTGMVGIEYLDWDELPLLPVFGFTWIPNDDLRFDIAFPRPKAAMRIMDTDTFLGFGGELAGGTWAIERDHSYDDNVTYSDVRIFFSIESFGEGHASSALELGYVFERDLEYRSNVGNYYPGDTMMIRWTGRH